MSKLIKNLVGKKFNRLLVIERSPDHFSKVGVRIVRWKCLCDCGKLTIVRANKLASNHTKSCGCWNDECRVRSGLASRRGTKNISKTYFTNVKRNARLRNFPVTITIEDAQALLEKQNFKCALTNRDIFRGPGKVRDTKRNTASLDRIDSTKGYIKGNIQWVHKDVNIMKQAFTEKYFYETCKEIYFNLSKPPRVKFVKVSPEIKTPTQATSGSAGYDIYCPEDIEVRGNVHWEEDYFTEKGFRSTKGYTGNIVTKIPTGLKVEIPEGYFIALYNRSSLGSKGLIIPNGLGVLDSDFRGEIQLMFINVSGKTIKLNKGDRIGQLVMQKYETLEFEEVSELSPTNRNLGGLGSTGV